MRQLLLTRGSAGVGKSTWLAQNNLTQYTLAADDIRLLFQSPVLDVNGRPYISPKNDHEVWDFLFNLLEKRMERGEFSIVDATHSRSALVNKYKHLAQKYRYRVYVVDFTDVPEEEIIRRNMQRPEHKQVPEDAIRTMVARLQTQPTPTWTTTIKPEEFWNHFGPVKTFDFNRWKRVHHIGDIHGSYAPLKEYFDRYGYNPDEFYIFVGDYFDRGIQNVETFEFLQQFVGQTNVLMLEGNHEIHVWKYANDEPAYSREFENVTKPQFVNSDVDKSKLREFYRRLGQLAFYEYGGKVVLVTHGGLPVTPTTFTATQELIKGVGKYEDVEAVEDAWNRNTPDNYYQVHGHRNPGLLPIVNGRNFNLNHTVEFGGDLRAVILDADGFHTVEIRNTVFATPDMKIETIREPQGSIIDQLRASPYIMEKKLAGNVSSFNFTREAFMKGKWEGLTTKARGLFINTATGMVVARSYDKFFNVNERDETRIDALRRKMQFPAVAWLKENGFLGIVGYDSETDTLLITTKSTIYGDFQKWFEDILRSKVDLDHLKAFVAGEGVSLIIEVIDPINDPHIIKYEQPDLVLLDVVYRMLDYRKYTYPELKAVGQRFGLRVKERAFTFNSWGEFYDWYNQVDGDYEHTFNGKPVEGYVIEDASGFMFKLKSEYYRTWKMFRGLKDRMAKRRPVDTAWLTTPVQNHVYAWLKTLPEEVLAANDIIKLRDMWLESVGVGV